MQCPACEGKLYKLTLHNLKVDTCTLCHGIWFDDGKLTTAVNKLIADESVKAEENQVLFKKRNIEMPDPNEGYRLCPKCTIMLKKTNFAYDSNVFVDKCSNCHGIWTDKGELKQIAGFLKNDPQTQEIGKALIQSQQERSELEELTGTGNYFLATNTLSSRRAVRYYFTPTFIMPLGDDNPVDRFPIATFMLITACSIVFALQLFFVQERKVFIDSFGYQASKPLGLTAFTSMFIHASIIHLISNMLFLWIFGKSVEWKTGIMKFAAIYFSAGYFGCLAQSIFSSDPDAAVVGASGAVSGIMGVYLAMFPKSRLKLFWMGRKVYLPAYLFIFGWFLLQVVYAFLFIDVQISDVAWFSHIGGFAAGYFVTRIIGCEKLKKQEEAI